MTPVRGGLPVASRAAVRAARSLVLLGTLVAGAPPLAVPSRAQAQAPTQGRSIGTVSTRGDLILVELDQGAVVAANPFDLEGRTLRFTPDGGGYRVRNLPLRWDADFGPRLDGSEVVLDAFSFPMSGSSWSAFSVGRTGTISLGADAPGSLVGRFAELREAASGIVGTVPVIAAFLKPRLSGPRWVKELADRVVVTWELTHPVGGIFDVTFEPTVNRFQAVLHRDGTIELSYQEVAAEDAIVGVYALPASGGERPLAALEDAEDPDVPAHLDVRGVSASVADGIGLEVAFETRGPVLPEGHARLRDVAYRVHFDLDAPYATGPDSADADVVWTVRGTPELEYVASGPGVVGKVRREGNTLRVFGLPGALDGAERFAFWVDVVALAAPFPVYDEALPAMAAPGRFRSARVDLSAPTPAGEPTAVLFEAFHHASRPDTEDMACTVIRALGDRFDFLVYYSDFPIDNQEAGTPSTGGIGRSVTGYGRLGRRPASAFCSEGRLQATYIQPVWVGSNQAHERAPDGSWTGFDYQMSQVSHELGHRWMAFAEALVGDDTLALGTTHWLRGLHAPAAFPYRRPVEASTMGGAVWQDNGDGTYTLLDDDFYVPATGYSHLDLYLMGLLPASEVPDFFFLKSLVEVGRDAEGRRVYTGDRVTVTVEDVIARNGPRRPAHGEARKDFNTGVVGLVVNGREPSPELLERTAGIREAWIDYWSKATGGLSTMGASVGGEKSAGSGR